MTEPKRQPPAPPADWFVEIIAEGIAKLYVLRLEGHPAADTLDGVEMVWVEALWYGNRVWDESLDAKRLRQAFVGLAQTLTRWPAPRVLLDHLPARPKRQALPKPEISEEEKARNRQRLAELMATPGMRPTYDDEKEGSGGD